MDDKLKKDWEQVISSTINDDPASRKEAFHNIFVSKTTSIMGNISAALRGAQTLDAGSGVDPASA